MPHTAFKQRRAKMLNRTSSDQNLQMRALKTPLANAPESPPPASAVFGPLSSLLLNSSANNQFTRGWLSR